MKNYILISLLFILTVFSCRKDFEENQITENPHVPVFIDNYHPAVENVTSSVFGVVVDEDGQAVEGAEISLGSLTQMTNVFGTFSFDNIEMNKKGTFVQVEKAGYFLSGRRFYPTEGNKNKIKIELLQKNFSESFESGVGGTVAISDNGGTIVFQPNSIRTEAGDSYNGTVHVATKYLDPTALVTFDQMPGALQGVNSSNEEGGLSTYGMIGVELQGDAGEQLNIADNQTAKITMNLPASLQGAAPAEIPLWSFNYTYGIWVEDGKALLQDGKYVGEVSHFSFWNCDLFSEVVGFGVAVVDNNQEPIEGAGVKISLANGLSSGFGYTGTNGYVGGILPANEELLLEVISPCGDILYTQTIGPFMAGISIGTIEIEVANVIEITGTILNCDGGEVNNGIVIIKQGGVFNSYIVDTNPFSIRIVACSNI
ncbi:MAG TPA: carboxypeptidase regulatory-like domain-containing protein, partial [Phaeodactylibacter sp.]|nr:carboxypeptidase regulatory-like domain-containing protein [Phaeodactylibacter sp.]